jgi:hypothetical protein
VILEGLEAVSIPDQMTVGTGSTFELLSGRFSGIPHLDIAVQRVPADETPRESPTLLIDSARLLAVDGTSEHVSGFQRHRARRTFVVLVTAAQKSVIEQLMETNAVRFHFARSAYERDMPVLHEDTLELLMETLESDQPEADDESGM